MRNQITFLNSTISRSSYGNWGLIQEFNKIKTKRKQKETVFFIKDWKGFHSQTPKRVEFYNLLTYFNNVTLLLIKPDNKNIMGKLSETRIRKFRLSIWQKMHSFLEPDHNGLNKRQGTPNEAFYLNPELLGLGRQIGQINSGTFRVFSAKLSAPILES